MYCTVVCSYVTRAEQDFPSMELNIKQILKLLTTLFTILHSVSISWASLDDFDMDGADALLNMASAFLKPNGNGAADSTGECTFTCPNGAKPQKNPGYVAVSNGCGAYGMKLDLSKLPNIEKCCAKHDVCYGSCNKKMVNCDESFNRCLNSVCDELEDDMGLTNEEAEGCRMVAQLMFSTVQGFGCGAYLDSQKEACICPAKTKKKKKTEL